MLKCPPTSTGGRRLLPTPFFLPDNLKMVGLTVEPVVNGCFVPAFLRLLWGEVVCSAGKGRDLKVLCDPSSPERKHACTCILRDPGSSSFYTYWEGSLYFLHLLIFIPVL